MVCLIQVETHLMTNMFVVRGATKVDCLALIGYHTNIQNYDQPYCAKSLRINISWLLRFGFQSQKLNVQKCSPTPAISAWSCSQSASFQIAHTQFLFALWNCTCYLSFPIKLMIFDAASEADVLLVFVNDILNTMWKQILWMIDHAKIPIKV